MNYRTAIAKLKAILLINLIVIALAAGSYFYLQTSGMLPTEPKPAEFIITDFKIDPLEAEEGEPITISVNVTDGMERDYFFFASLWFKVFGLPYLPLTVDPLPFHSMSAFLYPETESYPYEAHALYLE